MQNIAVIGRFPEDMLKSICADNSDAICLAIGYLQDELKFISPEFRHDFYYCEKLLGKIITRQKLIAARRIKSPILLIIHDCFWNVSMISDYIVAFLKESKDYDISCVMTFPNYDKNNNTALFDKILYC